GATQEASSLSSLLGSGKVNTLISSGPDGAWSGSDLSSKLNSTTPAILAPNAHYNETVAEPASYFYGNAGQSLLSDSSVTPAAGDIVFTMGCHAGLPLNSSLLGGPSWAELYGAGKDVYVANTGYGIGDDQMIAYSVRLLAGFSANLGSNMDVGQALMFAKQAYAAQGSIQGSIAPIDAKALQELTFYGLPNYTIGATGTSA